MLNVTNFFRIFFGCYVQELKIPLFRSLMWAIFVNAMFYAYGEVLYRFEVLAPYRHYHAWITFSLYVGIFIAYVLSLKTDLYKYQVIMMFEHILLSCFCFDP